MLGIMGPAFFTETQGGLHSESQCNDQDEASNE